MTSYDAEIYSGQTAALTVSYSFTEASQIKCLIKSSSGGTASAAVTSEPTVTGSLSLEVAVSSLDGVSCDYYWRCYSFYETASNTWSERTTLVDQDAGAVCSATPAPTAVPTGSPQPTTSAPIPQPTSSFAPTARRSRCRRPAARAKPRTRPSSRGGRVDHDDGVARRHARDELGTRGPRPSGRVCERFQRPPDCPDRAGGLLAWHDPATWADGVVPAVGADVVVSGDVLISSCSLSEGTYGVVTVSKGSSLVFADEPIELHVEGIVVEGELVIGSPSCRTMSPVSITLHGARPDDTMVAQDPSIKGIDVKNGTLELHGGLYVQTWSRLAVTAAAGDSSILIQDAVNWAVGDEIFVAGTTLRDDRAWHQNERFTVADVRAASHLGDDVVFVELSGALLFDHYGGDEYQAEACYESNGYGSYPCEDSYLTGFGGHVMLRGADAVGHISGVEFYRMGQTNFEGRYALHWHLLGDRGEGSYVTDSSFHRSFWRCVTIHGTNKVSVERNVGFDVVGHCLYLEDGVEEENVISFNLFAHIHVMGKPPGDSGTAQWLDNIYDSASLREPSDSTASAFYISRGAANGWNTVTGNAATGGFSGFHYPILPSPVGAHRDVDTHPRASRILLFDGNSCHSTGWWWSHAGCVYGRRPGGALSNVGLMHWGERSRTSKFEAHDLIGGPAAEVFGEAEVSEALVFEWDDDLSAEIGSTICDNSDGDGPDPCERVGWLAHFGAANVTAEGVKLMPNAEVVGTSGGFGWYLYLDQGAPKTLRISQIQVLETTSLLLAVSFPVGTSFHMYMEGPTWCSSSYLCLQNYTHVESVDEVRSGDGTAYHFADDGTLYLRVVQRGSNRLSETTSWTDDYEVSLMTSDLAGDWGIPRRSSYPHIVVKAYCAASDDSAYYCAGGGEPNVPQPYGLRSSDCDRHRAALGECDGVSFVKRRDAGSC
ncbi:hypothetical protein JL721_10482 [Aureococcus anophagefferens]|nr:hypothetical protein JL721_10482 [Aureococcus anophagefferens]